MGVARVAPPCRAAFDTLAVMVPAILLGAASLVALVLAVMYVAKTLRKRGRAEIDRRFPAADVLLSETLAQSYGQQSRGATQARGHAPLPPTTRQTFFLLYVPAPALHIALSAIPSRSHPPAHLLPPLTSSHIPSPTAAPAELDSLAGPCPSFFHFHGWSGNCARRACSSWLSRTNRRANR